MLHMQRETRRGAAVLRGRRDPPPRQETWHFRRVVSCPREVREEVRAPSCWGTDRSQSSAVAVRPGRPARASISGRRADVAGLVDCAWTITDLAHDSLLMLSDLTRRLVIV